MIMVPCHVTGHIFAVIICMCMCICICSSICACACVCAHIQLRIRVPSFQWMCTCMRACASVQVHARMRACRRRACTCVYQEPGATTKSMFMFMLMFMVMSMSMACPFLIPLPVPRVRFSQAPSPSALRSAVCCMCVRLLTKDHESSRFVLSRIRIRDSERRVNHQVRTYTCTAVHFTMHGKISSRVTAHDSRPRVDLDVKPCK